jgi:hypothetical protein
MRDSGPADAANLSARSIQFGTAVGKLAPATAAHAPAEGSDQVVIRPAVHAHRALLAAVLAGHEQATNTVLALAAERYGTDWLAVPGHTPE